AGPFFNGVKEIVRLDKGDASFVDVIHTNAPGNRLEGYGLNEPIGHVDFYPNGGENQPGCETASQNSSEIVDEILSYMNFYNILSKFRSMEGNISAT
ncbi:Pancreatic triacylglycerol lipase, partial [Stegodyphus mimosarum]